MQQSAAVYILVMNIRFQIQSGLQNRWHPFSGNIKRKRLAILRNRVDGRAAVEVRVDLFYDFFENGGRLAVVHFCRH